MGLKLYEETSVQAIADAIRAKNGSSDTYTISEMGAAIEDIPSGGGGENKYIMGLTMDLYKGSAMTVDPGFVIQATWNEQTDDIVFQLCGKADISSYKKLIVTGKTGDSYYHKYGEHNVRKIYIGTCDTPSNATFVPTSITWNEDPFIFTEAFSSFRAVIELGHSHDYLYFSANGWTIEDLTFAVVEDEYSVYKYLWSNDEKICIREGIGEIKWFFNGYVTNSGEDPCPQEFAQFIPSGALQGGAILGPAYSTSDATEQVGWIGFYQSQIRVWSMNKGSLITGTFYGVVDAADNTVEQHEVYTDPLDVPISDITLIEKTITENGTYSAEDDGYVGYSDVVVNTPTKLPDSGYNQIFKDSSMDVRFDTNGKFKVIWDGVTTVAIGCTMQGHTNLIGTYNNINIKGNIIDSCEYQQKYRYERTQFVVGVTGSDWQTAILVGYNDNGDVYKKEMIALTDQQVVNDIDIDIDLNELAQQGHQSAYLFISLLGISGEFEVTIT